MSPPLTQRRGKTIVIVDDESAYLDMLQQLLGAHLRCPVLGFSKPADALQALSGIDTGLIITDYQMPDMDGLQFIDEVQKKYPSVPFVMITAYQAPFTARQLAKVPALKAVVRKPFKWTELAELVVAHWPESRPPANQL